MLWCVLLTAVWCMCVNNLGHVLSKHIDDSDFRIKILRKRYWFPKKSGNEIKKESLVVNRVESGLLVLAPTEEKMISVYILLRKFNLGFKALLARQRVRLCRTQIEFAREIQYQGYEISTRASFFVFSQSPASPPIQPWRMTICWNIPWIDKSKLRIPTAEKANLNPTCLDKSTCLGKHCNCCTAFFHTSLWETNNLFSSKHSFTL